jgi:hypothetical protein
MQTVECLVGGVMRLLYSKWFGFNA